MLHRNSIAEGGENWKKEVQTMSEKKKEILAVIGKELPGMSETEKSYLIGFLEGFAASQNQIRLERAGA